LFYGIFFLINGISGIAVDNFFTSLRITAGIKAVEHEIQVLSTNIPTGFIFRILLSG
jgi:hypothetical protein